MKALTAFSDKEFVEASLASWNARIADMSVEERVEFALERLPGAHILSSSFGAQSAVSLHLMSAAREDIPVVFIDTGYLFDETHAFAAELTERLNLNLITYRPLTTRAWQEAHHGERWLQGKEGLEAYNFDNKVEPMRRALDELAVGTWFTGIRRQQSTSRADTPFIDFKNGHYKVAPLADWTDRDVHQYLKAHDLPYHPLWEQGYVSIGDVHTTRPIHEVDNLEETRFFGLKRECGLHDRV